MCLNTSKMTQHKKLFHIIPIFVTVAFFCVAGIVNISKQAVTTSASLTATPLDFSITNEYPPLGSLLYYKWEYVVEPYRLSTLSVEQAADGSDYFWTISIHGEPVSNSEGYSTVFIFTEPGSEYDVELKRVEYHPTGPLIHFRHARCMCKYVKREIRALTDEDRESYFRAMEVVARTPMNPGAKTYGEHFVNLGYETVKHVHGNTCSPFHGWLSFFTAHASFTLELDNALRAVNPRVTQPYWDFTVDSLELGNNWYESIIFTDEYFGTATPSNPERAIDGRFSNTPVTTSYDFVVHNAFGRVTDMRNQDPSPYATRSHEFCGINIDYPIPGCSELAECLQKDNLVDLHDCSENILHGNIHTVIGGVWDCPYSMTEMQLKHPERKELLLNLGVRSVNIWQKMNSGSFGRPGVMRCPTYCDSETTFDECRCTCPELDNIPSDKLNTTTVKKVLADMDVISWDEKELAKDKPNCDAALQSHYLYKKFMNIQTMEGGGCDYSFKNMTTDENREFMVFLLRYSCNPGKMGAMCTGAAANDPVFWPIHPLFDRLWAYIRLSDDYVNFNHTWKDDSSCYGRSKDDTMPFKNLLNEGSDKFYTNGDLYNLFDPSNPDLTYIYDHFDWDHCNPFIVNYTEPTKVW